MSDRQVVEGIDNESMPMPVETRLAELHFGEGCLMEEYVFLRGLAMLLQPRCILEVGTSCGVGGLMLLDGASAFGRNAHLTTIDCKRGEAFESNLAHFPHLSDKVERIIETSDAALARLAKGQRHFDLVFLDGDHSPEQVSRDWRNVRELSDLFVLHDTDQMPGCRELASRIRQEGDFEVFRMTYPLGHQAFKGVVAQGKTYEGVYHQSQLAWTSGGRGPGMALVQRRR